ncbi:YTH-domain-containing protein, partial [Hyphopichia burtonii NRRL Y-1933]
TFKNTNGNFFDVSLKSRFFVIKSYNINDVEASFQNGIWSSTDLGNKRLNKAFIELKSSSSTDKVLLFFLVNGSRKFCGVCEMIGLVDFNLSSNIWSETSRYKGVFPVNWLIIKDIPNKYFNHLLIPSNENKPVTNSRDTQEVPFDTAIAILKIFSTFK